MDNVLNIITIFLANKWIQSAIIIVVAVVIYRIIASITARGEKRNRLKKVKGKTYLRLIRNISKYIILTFVVLTLLQIHGVNVGSMVAGLGILGIIIGFIVQDAFKDIIRGMDILSDDYFSVGDVVKYNNIEGKVKMLGLKTTKIEDIRTGNIISIANRNIEQIELVSERLQIYIPMPYEIPVKKAEKIIDQMKEQIEKDSRISNYIYKGINELADSSLTYLVEVCCNQTEKLQVRRDLLRIVITTFESNKIAVPYKQIDIHNK